MANGFFKRIEDGLVLTSDNLNINYSSVSIKRQEVDDNVEVGNLVVYDYSQQFWVRAVGEFPVGMYVGDGIIVFSGYVYNLSGLETGSFYWLDEYGDITVNKDDAYDNIKVGYAISDSEMLLSIDLYLED